MSVGSDSTKTASTRSPFWRAIVDASLGLARSSDSLALSAGTIIAAIDEAENVPSCVVCETLYAQILFGNFGIDKALISEYSESALYNEDTLFAIGRSAFVGIDFNYHCYLDFILCRTCVALHDVDFGASADGLFALAAIGKSMPGGLKPMEARFLRQGLQSLDVLLEIYPHPKAREIAKAARALCQH